MTGERGFTVVEALVAILMLTIGLFGVAKATAEVTKMVSRGNRAATASSYVQERLEALQARGCDLITAGSEVRGAVYDLRWTIGASAGPRARRVQLVVTYPGERAMRMDTVETAVSCR